MNVLPRVRIPRVATDSHPARLFFRRTLPGHHGHTRRGKVHHVPVEG